MSFTEAVKALVGHHFNEWATKKLPAVQALLNEKIEQGETITVEELSEVFADFNVEQKVARSYVPVSGGSRVKTSRKTTSGLGCSYRKVRGAKDMCPGKAIVNNIFCSQCSAKRASVGQFAKILDLLGLPGSTTMENLTTDQMKSARGLAEGTNQSTFSSSRTNSGGLAPPVKKTSALHARQQTDIDGIMRLVTYDTNFVIEPSPGTTDYVCIGMFDDDKSIQELNSKNREECKSIGLMVGSPGSVTLGTVKPLGGLGGLLSLTGMPLGLPTRQTGTPLGR
jgi:hypothetical protein